MTTGSYATAINAMRRLHEAGLLSAEELADAEVALAAIAAHGPAAVDEADEDVHSAIERKRSLGSSSGSRLTPPTRFDTAKCYCG